MRYLRSMKMYVVTMLSELIIDIRVYIMSHRVLRHWKQQDKLPEHLRHDEYRKHYDTYRDTMKEMYDGREDVQSRDKTDN